MQRTPFYRSQPQLIGKSQSIGLVQYFKECHLQTNQVDESDFEVFNILNGSENITSVFTYDGNESVIDFGTN
ncbi:hypothetical protein CL6EHI_c00008 [Entamoeba histolytica]|uniref:Uncharacterized protein n=2 Tax=Entamoeba TaxID=5758 RepID=A0A175JDH7_ENTHI|nr:hypothetical protein CL6EHI_c00008 [Entamoeba histolytica]